MIKDQLPLLQRLVTPSIFDVIVTTTFLMILVVSPLIQCYDIWWHLKTGELIFNGVFPTTDPYSFTAFGRPWILHEWGSELIFYFLYKNMGIPGLMLLKAFICALIFGTGFKLMLLKRVNIVISVVFTLFIIAGTVSSWTVRPHLFTNLFLVILFYIYVRFRHYADMKILRWLPVLFLLWINLHGGFAIGFAFLGLCISVELLCMATGAGEDPLSFPAIEKLIIYAALSFAACFINPNTYKGVCYPLLYLGDQMPSSFITEWAPSSMANHIEFAAVALFIIVTLSLSRKKLFYYEITLICVFTYFAFSAVRHIAIFVLVVIPIIARLWQDIFYRLFQEIIKQFKGKALRVARKVENYFSDRLLSLFLMENQLRFHLIPLLVILISALLLHIGVGKSFFGVKEEQYPITAVKFMKKSPIAGNLFNQYGWGGYIIQHLPGKKVFIDGRMDVYQKEVSTPYKTILNLEDGWEDKMTEYGITHILVAKKTVLARLITKISPDWEIVMEDEHMRLFKKKEF